MTELEERLAQVDARLTEINATFQQRRFPESVRAEWNQLNAERDELAATIAETQTRMARLRDLAGNPAATERVGQGQDSATPTARPDDLLNPQQSVTDWMHRRGHLRDQQQQAVSFDRYLRALIGGQVARPQAALSEGVLTGGGHLVPTPAAGNGPLASCLVGEGFTAFKPRSN